MSGILAEKNGWVEEEFREEGMQPVKQKTDGQWAAVLLRREAH
jgi:ribosomal protein L11 methylase PrmA